MSIAISVIVCTHNPNPEFFGQVIAALRSQTLAKEVWELLIVDNSSIPPVAPQFHPAWHPNGKMLSEPVLGKTNALLLAIGESKGDLMVIVDDDNVLAADYLQMAQTIAKRWPILGSWGGSIEPRYQLPPPDWLKSYETYLSVRKVTEDLWFNLSQPSLYGLLPYGAGLCVRRRVAEEYYQRLMRDPIRRQLGRKGQSLVSGEDTDLVLVGCVLGLGNGLFKDLRLEHLIHGGRVTESYMERMLRDMTYSLILLAALRGHVPDENSLLRHIWGYWSAMRRGKREFLFHHAAMRGAAKARAEILGGCLSANHSKYRLRADTETR